MDDDIFGAIRDFLEGFAGVVLGLLCVMGIIFVLPDGEPKIKYIYDDEARLVGFCNGKYLIRTEEDEFPKAGCMFIEPITWKD